MKFVEHFEQQTVSFQNVSKVWGGVILQSAFFICLFAFLSHINYFTNIFPEYGVYTFHLGLISLIPSIVLLGFYHSLRLKIKSRYHKITPQFILLGKEATRLRTYMIIGIFLADFTMLVGVAHLVLTANLVEAAYFWLSSVFFCINYKPCVRYINCSVKTKAS